MTQFGLENSVTAWLSTLDVRTKIVQQAEKIEPAVFRQMFRQFDRHLCKEAGGVMPNEGLRCKVEKIFVNLVTEKNYYFDLSSFSSRTHRSNKNSNVFGN